MKEKIYNIQSQELKLYKIKIIQLEMLADLIGDIDLGENVLGLADIIKEIRKKGVANFFQIVFYGQDTENISWKDVDYETVDEVIEDFFALNPRLKKRIVGFLNDFLPKLVGILTAFSKGTP